MHNWLRDPAGQVLLCEELTGGEELQFRSSIVQSEILHVADMDITAHRRAILNRQQLELIPQ